MAATYSLYKRKKEKRLFSLHQQSQTETSKYTQPEPHVLKYVRVDSKTDTSTIVELMTNVWRMQKPNLIIYVAGGVYNYNIDPNVQYVFQYELMKAAVTTDAWIITGINNTGVTKLVGEMNEYYGLMSANPKCAIIGTAPSRHSQEIHDQGSHHTEEERNQEESLLDPNYTHFFLIDDDAEIVYKTAISLWAELERKISNMKINTCDDQTNQGSVVPYVPTVLLVHEGRLDTLEAVKNALMENKPVVVVKGSGGAAHILAYALENASDGEDHTVMKPALEAEIRKELMSMNCPNEAIDDNIKVINNCLAKSNLIHICAWYSGSAYLNMEEAILKALFKANTNQLINHLGLALAWDKFDIAATEIFTDDKIWQPSKLENILQLAIMKDRVKFVENFLYYDYYLNDFLTIKKLLELYNNQSRTRGKSFLDNLLKEKRQKRKNVCTCRITLNMVGQLIQDLLGDYYDSHYISDDKYSETDGDLSKIQCDRCNKPIEKRLADVIHGSMESTPSDSKNFMDNPMRELFIWSVLNNQRAMAEQFWMYGKDAIAAALVAHALLSAMSRRTDSKELIEQYAANADKFTDLAIGVLKESQKSDVNNIQRMLIRRLKDWGNTSCILIAVAAKNERFISQPECQDIFRCIWNGQMTQANSTLKATGQTLPLTCWHAAVSSGPLSFFPLCMIYMDMDVLLDQDKNINSELHPAFLEKSLEECGSRIVLDRLIIYKIVRFQSSEDGFGIPALIECILIVCSFIPPLIPLLAKFKENGDDHEAHNRDQQAQKTREPSQSSRQEHENNDDSVHVTNGEGKRLNTRKKFLYFYRAPVVVFCHNVITYMVFLCLYSYILICHFEENPSLMEYILIGWVFTLFSEEFRQVYYKTYRTWKTKFQSYITDGWNQLDVVTILLFATGIILRFIPHPRTFEVARIVLGVDLVMFYLRILHIFRVHKELGPKLIMILHAAKSLAYFFVIILVFIVAYAVAAHGILYPNVELSPDSFIAIFRRPYWNIFGDLMLDEIEDVSVDCTNDTELYRNGTYSRCPTVSGKYVVLVLMGFYMLVCNILLINLLITIFTGVLGDEEYRTNLYWNLQLNNLIDEYGDRSILPPPFSAIECVIRLIIFFVRKCRRPCEPNSSAPRKGPFLKDLAVNELNQQQWEYEVAAIFNYNRKQAYEDGADHTNQYERLEKKIVKMQEQQQELTNKMFESMKKWIVDSLKEHNLGSSQNIS